jgi:hypothetical protein
LFSLVVKSSLELVGDLDDAYHDFMRIPILVQQTEFHHGVIPFDVAFNIDHLVVLEVLLNLLLKNKKCVGKVHFKRTGVICGGLHMLVFNTVTSGSAQKPM